MGEGAKEELLRLKRRMQMISRRDATPNADELDVDDVVDPDTGIRYIGTARRFFGDTWRDLAQVGSALCLVEVTVSPTIVVGHDGGDEDDATRKRSGVRSLSLEHSHTIVQT